MQGDTWLDPVSGSASVARAMVRQAARDMGLDDRSVFEVMVAATEAVANAVEHGSGQPILLFRPGRRRLVVEVVNSGPPVCGALSQDGERGRGLPLMAATVDSLELHPTHDATRVLLHKRLRAA